MNRHDGEYPSYQHRKEMLSQTIRGQDAEIQETYLLPAVHYSTPYPRLVLPNTQGKYSDLIQPASHVDTTSLKYQYEFYK